MDDVETHPAEAAHESRDVHRRGLLLFAVGFSGVIVLSVAILWVLFGAGRDDIAAARRIDRAPQGGELAQHRQLTEYLDAQKAELERLGWLDRAHTRAKIPIEAAIGILAAKGRMQ